MKVREFEEFLARMRKEADEGVRHVVSPVPPDEIVLSALIDRMHDEGWVTVSVWMDGGKTKALFRKARSV